MKKYIFTVVICAFFVTCIVFKISNITLKNSKYINKNSKFKISYDIHPLSIHFENSNYIYTFKLLSIKNIKNNIQGIINYIENKYKWKNIKNAF